MSRFDYVKYDEHSQFNQVKFKTAFELLEQMIDQLPNGRAKALAMTKFEESYMWVGKALRDDQIARSSFAEHKEAALK